MSIGDLIPSPNSQPSTIHSKGGPILEHLNLDNYKVSECPVSYTHNHKHCIYYHNETDRRRPECLYTSQMCYFISKNQECPYGDSCKQSHNRVEQLFRPDKYKTKFCTYYPYNLDKCDYGAFCCFAHSEEDCTVELIHNLTYDDDFFMFHYKTQWCPYNLAYHDKALCVYAHNLQDFRRKPNLYSYEPTACPNWNVKKFIYEYQDGCPQSSDCKYCHGWKELEFHPLVYKTKPCNSVSKCKKNLDCPNFHNFSERREVSVGLNFGILKLVPKNRVIQFTFKKACFEYYNKAMTNSTDIPTLDSRTLLKSRSNLYQGDSIINSKPNLGSTKQLSFTRGSRKRSTLIDALNFP